MQSLLSNACWTASSNAALYLHSAPGEKERAKLLKEAGPYSGIFKLDYAKNCALLGVVPHPQLTGERRMRTSADVQRDKEKEREQREEQERKAKEEAEEKERPQSASAADSAAPAPAAAPSPPSSKKPASAQGGQQQPQQPHSAKGRSALSSAEKLTPAQRAAAELASATAALSAEEQKPVTELSVRGWELDIGSAAALQLTIPHCKSLHTLRFWHAQLSARSVTLLAESLKGSSVTQLYLDWNPLLVEKGEEPALVYSLLLAPSSPLQVLSLRGNAITSSLLSELARTLCANKTLLSLDLFENCIDDAAADSIARLLGLNQTLLALNLGRNRLSDASAVSLASAFQSVPLLDKEEAKALKRAGFKVSVVKAKTYREANQSLKRLYLPNNYIGEEGLRAWLAMLDEQIMYAPGKGMIQQEDGSEIPYKQALPERLQPKESEVKSDEAVSPPPAASLSPSAVGSRISSAASALGSSRPSARRATAADADAGAGAAGGAPGPGRGAKKEKEEEEVRYPGQLNALQLLDLSGQFAACSELSWFQLSLCPLVHWNEEGETWSDELTEVRAIDWAKQLQEEEERQAAQTAEERAAEELEKAEQAAAEKAAAEAAMTNTAGKGKKAKKKESSKGSEN